MKKNGLGTDCILFEKYHIHTKAADILNRFPLLIKRLTSVTTVLAPTRAPRALGLGAALEKAGTCIAGPRAVWTVVLLCPRSQNPLRRVAVFMISFSLTSASV